VGLPFSFLWVNNAAFFNNCFWGSFDLTGQDVIFDAVPIMVFQNSTASANFSRFLPSWEKH
jgi:hypothetical protein